jgi:hypothetical protein
MARNKDGFRPLALARKNRELMISREYQMLEAATN